ncbi:DUF3426 domain-containing protein [Psychrobacter sp. AOP22-C1-C5]|uniref:DUF3426 domain-containing protein n=1 Tax=Psychrobacter sp. AOP22-C1-C5 TaxID=3457716 RepID=UPI004035F63C
MTTPINIQCPHCQALLNVQQTQINKVNATIKCEHCGQSLLGMQQRDTVTSDTHHKNSSSNRNSPLNTQKTKDLSSDTLIHDDLIYDDMDIDESSEAVLEYDSLDSMDAWLTEASHTSTVINEPSNNTSKVTSKDNRSSVKPSIATTATTASKHSSTAQPILSSVAANDIHASIDRTADNSWLEELLKEQNQREDTQQDDTDLSKLLLDMGVPLKGDSQTSKAQLRHSQTQARFGTPSERQEQQRIASLLWTLGCLVLALLLFAQYVIFNLENLVKDPVYAQRLQAICSVAACSLPSADLTAFTITNLDHRSSQVDKTGSFSDVSATLNNQSAKAQLYPDLKVSIYGANDMIGEFIAAPEDYLVSKQNHLTADSGRQLLFTIPVANTKIREITISPLY